MVERAGGSATVPTGRSAGSWVTPTSRANDAVERCIWSVCSSSVATGLKSCTRYSAAALSVPISMVPLSTSAEPAAITATSETACREADPRTHAVARGGGGHLGVDRDPTAPRQPATGSGTGTEAGEHCGSLVRLVEAGAERGVALPLAAVEPVRTAEVPLARGQRDRDGGDERDRRQAHVEHEQRNHGERDLQHREEHDGDGVAHRVGEDRDVARDAAHEIAGARPLHEVDRHRERVIEDLFAHLGERILAHDRGAHAAEVAEDGGDDRQHRVRERGAVDGLLRVGGVVRDRVDDHTDQRGAGQRGDGRRALQDHGDGDAAPPVAQQPQHAGAGSLRCRGGECVVVEGGGHAGDVGHGATRSR